MTVIHNDNIGRYLKDRYTVSDVREILVCLDGARRSASPRCQRDFTPQPTLNPQRRAKRLWQRLGA